MFKFSLTKPSVSLIPFGSGLILHHTLLPTLIHLLETIPSLYLTSAPYPQTPPDVLVQQCLSGDIALCLTISNANDTSPTSPSTPFTPSSSSSATPGPYDEFPLSPYPALPKVTPIPDVPPLLTPSSPPAFLVSSRMLMAHTGHALSTGDRTYRAGQWGCGWRQPMLGARGVSVVDI